MAVGLAAVEELKSVVGSQEYATPLTAAAPMVAPLALEVHVLVKSVPAAAVGALTSLVIVILADAVQPLLVVVAVTV
mgnify:CR=1 FL=1